MVDDAVENGLGPGGRPAKLFQHHRCHASIQCLEVVAVPLAICPTLRHFFSEKLSGNREIWPDSVNLDVQPQFRPLRLDDVDIGSVDGAHTARGRLPILSDLIRDEHSLLSGGRHSRLPGKLREEVSDSVVSACVETLCATGRVPAK